MIKNRRLLFKQFLALFFFTQILIFSFSIISCPSASAQSESQLTESLNFKPQVSIPLSEFTAKQEVSVGKVNENTGKMESDLLGRYMLAIVNYALAAVAILATVVLMGGGLLWLTSRGDSSQVGKAKGLIGGSLTGMILLLCSWIILNTINPKLTEFQSIDTQVVDPTNYQIMTCCHPTNGEVVYKISESKGKKVIASGEYKGEEAKCPSGASQCSDNNICVAYGKNDMYFCAPDNICCQCNWEDITGYTNNFCWSPTTKDDCDAYCSDHRGAKSPSYYSSETHTCPPLGGWDGKCVNK